MSRVHKVGHHHRTTSTETEVQVPEVEPLRVSDGFEKKAAGPAVAQSSSAYMLTNEGGAVLDKPVINTIRTKATTMSPRTRSV